MCQTGARLNSQRRSRFQSLLGGREIWALADQAVVSATNFLTNVVIARALGVTQYGVFALSWLALLFVNSIQNALIVAPMMSIGSKTEDENRPHYFGAVVIQELCFAIFSVAGINLAIRAVAIYFHQPGLNQLAWPLSITVLTYLIQDFFRRYLFATKQRRRAFLNDVVSYVPQLLIIVLLARAGQLTTARSLWTIAFTSIFGIVAGIIWLEKISYDASKFRSVVSQHWKFSRWLIPSGMMEWTSSYLFLMAAPIYFGAVAAGALRSAQNIVGVAHIWFLGLENVVPAETARMLHNSGIYAAEKYIMKIVAVWGTITGVFILMVTVAPNFWLQLVYGSKYLEYGHLLRLYGVLYLLVFFGGPLRASLQALEFTVPIFWSYCVMTVFSLIFAVPFVKWFGLSGVIIGSIVTQIIFQVILASSLVVKLIELRQMHASKIEIPTL
jgi:O-antigen/teichoic acid export membrane protein